jgi:flagellar hook-length control protein FliK
MTPVLVPPAQDPCTTPRGAGCGIAAQSPGGAAFAEVLATARGRAAPPPLTERVPKPDVETESPVTVEEALLSPRSPDEATQTDTAPQQNTVSAASAPRPTPEPTGPLAAVPETASTEKVDHAPARSVEGSAPAATLPKPAAPVDGLNTIPRAQDAAQRNVTESKAPPLAAPLPQGKDAHVTAQMAVDPASGYPHEAGQMVQTPAGNALPAPAPNRLVPAGATPSLAGWRADPRHSPAASADADAHAAALALRASGLNRVPDAPAADTAKGPGSAAPDARAIGVNTVHPSRAAPDAPQLKAAAPDATALAAGPATPAPAPLVALAPRITESMIEAAHAAGGNDAPLPGSGHFPSISGPTAAAGPSLPMPTPAAQVLQAIQTHAALPAGSERIEIVLSPIELGRVEITWSPKEAAALLTIAAERPETLELLRRNIDSLLEDLRRMGFGDAQLNLAGERGNAPPHVPSPRPQFETMPAPAPVQAVTAPPLAHAGRLDIRM